MINSHTTASPVILHIHRGASMQMCVFAVIFLSLSRTMSYWKQHLVVAPQAAFTETIPHKQMSLRLKLNVLSPGTVICVNSGFPLSVCASSQSRDFFFSQAFPLQFIFRASHCLQRRNVVDPTGLKYAAKYSECSEKKLFVSEFPSNRVH